MEKYVKVRKIGEGAFGKAELVKRKQDGLQMVIKEINIMRMNAKEREDSRKESMVTCMPKSTVNVAFPLEKNRFWTGLCKCALPLNTSMTGKSYTGTLNLSSGFGSAWGFWYCEGSQQHSGAGSNMYRDTILPQPRDIGSYPPLSPKYSYDLRNLVSALFKRAPRDRPSINSVLRKPFISQRVPKFLSTEELESEFSHTVMHGHKLGRALPPPPKPAARPPSGHQPRGQEVQVDPVQEVLLVPAQEVQLVPVQVVPLVPVLEVQLGAGLPLARMHKAREEGWTSLIGSMESDSGKDNKREEVREPVRAAGIGGPAIGVQRPIAGPAGDQNGKAARGKYEHYNQYLDKLEQDREIRKRQEGIPPKAPVQAYMGAPKPLPAGPAHVRPLPGTPDPWRRAPQPSPVYQQYNQRGANQQQERAELVEDFISRRKAAANNKMRGQAELPMAPSPAPAFPITGAVHALGVNPRVIGEAPPPQPGPGITNVLGALGGPARGVADEDQDRAKTPMQKQKESILKKLNEKGPPKEEAPESARPRWGEGGPGLKFAEKPETMEVARPQWGGGGVGLKLAEKPDTPDPARPHARDRVIMNPDSVRRQWGRPGETVVKALQGVPLAEQTMASDKSEGSLSSASTGEGPTPSAAIGSTITITKAPAITKGTITIRTAEENKKQATESELQPPTSTEDDDRLSTIPETASSQLDSPTKGRSPTRSPTQAPTVTSLVGKTVDNIVAEPENQKKDSEQIVESHVEADEKKDSPTKEVVKPPIPARKPPLPEKPVTLPKPVLLPKPDAPMEFAPSRPSSVKSLGAGTFFEKKRKTGLVLGMTMGSFDIGHRELLRTCSEPDLAGLFRTMTQESPLSQLRHLKKSRGRTWVGREMEIRGVSLDRGKRREKELNRRRMEKTSKMMTEEDSKKSPVKFSLSSDQGSGGDANRSDSVDNENPETPDGSRDDGMSELFPTDDSDSEFNDEEDMGDFDLFGRLEETRAQLEEALGADKLIQVYKTIQALQEDEDENMEEGARIAQDLLGPSHIHLYPKFSVDECLKWTITPPLVKNTMFIFFYFVSTFLFFCVCQFM
ncbi:NEK1-like protein [Mya arenaria]|uniref:non-specific serine/threonine protein kinase n=1 Tax=Mya arenaria TaxID=6604 RepID=A0ABY7DQ74_MYAAR|nr:NEK1-like protein [Mya arenaria]